MAAIHSNTPSGDPQHLQTEQQRQQSLTDRKQLLCRFHLKGSCRDGESCHFSHNRSESVTIPEDVCWYYLHSHCMYGKNCRFVHLDATSILANQTGDRPELLSSNGPAEETIGTSITNS